MKKSNWIKLAAIVAIVLLAFVIGCNCGRGKTKTQTITVNHDSIVVRYKPSPYAVLHHDTLMRIKIKTQYDSDTIKQTDFVTEPVDTAMILMDYFGEYHYSDTIKFKRGRAIVNDTVTQNRIVGREFKLYTTDTTFRDTLEQKSIWYIGVSVSGNPQYIFSGVGWDLSVKTKNDMIYTGGVRFIKGGTTYYEAGTKFPIRLKRKR